MMGLMVNKSALLFILFIKSVKEINKFLSFCTGVFFLYFYPIYGDFKPFDIFMILLFFINIPYLSKMRVFRFDILFFLFICFALFSLLFSKEITFMNSLLQTLRYLFYFIVARLISNISEQTEMFIKGLSVSFLLTVIYNIFDLIYYYFSGSCRSLSEQLIPTNPEKILVHKLPLEFLGCLYYRVHGFSWDPGGLYPLMIVLALFLERLKGKSKYLHISGIFSFIAFSRTGILGYVIALVYKTNKFIIYIVLFIIFLFMVLINTTGYINKIDEGTARHLSYPFLAYIHVFSNPIRYISGTGLRGSLYALPHKSELPPYFSGFGDVISGNAVVESIWINILLGSGLIGFLMFFLWIRIGLKNDLMFITLFIVGLFYTFDSSQFCFFIPFTMNILRKMDDLKQYRVRKK
jgi:hypothetical protein